MCINYHALNERTIKNTYSLPRIQESIDVLGKAKYLSKIDLVSSYWQVRVKEDDIHKTAFNMQNRKYDFLAMPFGLTIAPATFQNLVNKIVYEFLDQYL